MFKVILIGLACLASMLSSVQAGVPVVMVHGFFGYGPEEALGINYFAYADQFEAEGYEVFEASVGPVSSNWDRACELYAQIKGTVVDYGAAHSAANGHSRFGRDFSQGDGGFYEEWSENNPIHLLGHSMGGQTIRLLEMLLREGDPDELASTGSGSGTSDLFKGNRKWIKTISTLSTPHDGTELTNVLGDGLIAFLRDIIIIVAGLFDGTPLDSIYDFDLGHWGVSRQSGESPDDYWNRLESTVLRDDNNDLAPFDLSPTGARIQNQRGQQAYSDTYYFAYASEDTVGLYQCFWFLRCGTTQIGDVTSMLIFLQPFAALLGGIDIAPAARRNDGVVTWEYQKCPRTGYSNPNKCRQYNGNWVKGTWNWQSIDYLDHLKTSSADPIRDIFNYNRSGKKLYRDHAQRIREIDDPSYTAQGVQVPDVVTGGSENFVVEEDPTLLGAIILVGVLVALGVVGALFLVKLRKARNQSGASSRTASYVSNIPRKVSTVFKSKDSSTSLGRNTSAGLGSVASSGPPPHLRSDSLASNRNYSQGIGATSV